MNPLPDYADALQIVLRGITPLNDRELIALEHCGGRILAETISADRDLPPFDRAQMDGYALRAAEFSPGKAWVVDHMIAAGASPDVNVEAGHCVAIATGAALPRGLDTVIQHELSNRGDRSGGPVRFTIDSIEPGHAVHRCGSDARKGAALLSADTVLAAQHLGIAAAVGKTTLHVRRRPIAIVLTSGDEVVPASTSSHDLLPHKIRNSNGPMIAELLRKIGAEPIDSQHLLDDRDATIKAVGDAIQRADLVITIGGVSAGERDHFPTAFDANKISRTLKGASIQPGKPIVVGHGQNGATVVGLPGNPVSALACACLFIWPIVRAMLGLSGDLPWRNVTLAETVKPNPHRRAFRPAILRDFSSAIVPKWAGSGDLAHTATTHGLIELPVQTEAVPAGSVLRFLPWP